MTEQTNIKDITSVHVSDVKIVVYTRGDEVIVCTNLTEEALLLAHDFFGEGGGRLSAGDYDRTEYSEYVTLTPSIHIDCHD